MNNEQDEYITVQVKAVSKEDAIKRLAVWQMKGYNNLLEVVRMFDQDDGSVTVGFMDYSFGEALFFVPEHMNRTYKKKQHALGAVGALFDELTKWNALMDEIHAAIPQQANS